MEFLEGFWHGESQAQERYPHYQLDYGDFTLPEDISRGLNCYKKRNDEGEDQGDADENDN